jgi:TonB family protein
MPHALLLSPDDQAVSAITGVLEEMSVTCERPLDGVSAAQKLNSQSFDLVLVDCENLPAAKLIFDVCRRGKNGNNPVPIAIVDGRAGLPTAFRLGAELILTKPVAKDQARTTIRTAVGRVRKDAPASENVLAHAASAPTTSAGAASSQLTSFAESAPSFTATSVPAVGGATFAGITVASTTMSAAAPAMQMQAAVEHSTVGEDEIDASLGSLAPKTNPKSASLAEPFSSGQSLSDQSLSEQSSSLPSPPAATPVKSKPAPPTVLSDDPVLADIERAELEALELKEGQAKTEVKVADPKAKPAQSDLQVFAPVLSYPQNRQKPRGALVALLGLALACAGFYAAWTYQPGFREIAQPQIDHALVLVDHGLVRAGIEHPAQTLPSSTATPKPVPAPTPATTAAALETPADPNQIPTAATDSTAGSPAATLPVTSPNASATNASAPPAATAAKSATVPAAAAATSAATAVPIVTKSSDAKSNEAKADNKADNKSDSKKDALAAALSNAPLPGENSAIILSSKGAEKRLSHSVPPKYPAAARAGAEGTIVLKEVVDETGKVGGVRLVEGDANLAAAAMDAVKQWRYRPYVRDGKVQAFQTVVIIDFQHP